MQGNKSLEDELDAWARSKGYPSHRAMASQLEDGRAVLPRDQSRRYLRELEPIADRASEAAANAAVDATGLPPVQDFIRSLARMVRVLLLGYTPEECEFIQNRFLGRVLLADSPHRIASIPTGRRP